MSLIRNAEGTKRLALFSKFSVYLHFIDINSRFQVDAVAIGNTSTLPVAATDMYNILQMPYLLFTSYHIM